MQVEIGSNFWLNPQQDLSLNSTVDIKNFGVTCNDFVFLSSGRSAERCVLKTIEHHYPGIQKIALLPPFTCYTVIDPFIEYGYKIYSYPIADDLTISPERLQDLLMKTGANVVLFHRYFGFDTLQGVAPLVAEFIKKGIIFIEDKTQCIYSDLPELPVNYFFGSLRKWTGVPDGAFAACRNGFLAEKPEEYDTELESTKVKASYLKYEYMINGKDTKAEFRKWYGVAEEFLNAQDRLFKMSPISLSIQANTDVAALRIKRQQNYHSVYHALINCPSVKILTPRLQDENVPLYLMLLVKNRNDLQTALREQNIYAPILWPIPANIPEICEEAKVFYAHGLCIPIDQRYDLDDMQRITDTIKDFYSVRNQKVSDIGGNEGAYGGA